MMQSLVYSVVRTNKATYKLIKEQEDRKKSSTCFSTTCSTPLVPSSADIQKAAQPLAIVKSGSKVHPWSSIYIAGPTDSSSECSEVHEQDNAALPPLTSLRLEVVEHLEDEEYEQDGVRVRGHRHGHGQLSNGSSKGPPEVLISDLEDAVGHLKVVFESNICVSKSLEIFYFVSNILLQLSFHPPLFRYLRYFLHTSPLVQYHVQCLC